MPEHVQILSRVDLDGSQISCSHAVLITQEDPAGAWEVVMLGTSSFDAERLTSRCPASQELTLTTSQGELLTSTGCIATITEDSFLRLKGSAPLERLVA